MRRTVCDPTLTLGIDTDRKRVPVDHNSQKARAALQYGCVDGPPENAADGEHVGLLFKSLQVSEGSLRDGPIRRGGRPIAGFKYSGRPRLFSSGPS